MPASTSISISLSAGRHDAAGCDGGVRRGCQLSGQRQGSAHGTRDPGQFSRARRPGWQRALRHLAEQLRGACQAQDIVFSGLQGKVPGWPNVLRLDQSDINHARNLGIVLTRRDDPGKEVNIGDAPEAGPYIQFPQYGTLQDGETTTLELAAHYVRTDHEGQGGDAGDGQQQRALPGALRLIAGDAVCLGGYWKNDPRPAFIAGRGLAYRRFSC